MEKFIYDENNGLWYELQGDYYLPCLKLPEENRKKSAFGVCGIWTILNITANSRTTDFKRNVN